MLIAKLKPFSPAFTAGIAFTLLLPACSMLPSSPEKVQQLQAQEQYDKALEHYQRLNSEQQQTIDLKQLQQAKTDYESKQIQKIQALTQQHEFAKAYQTQKDSAANLPTSEALSQQKAAIYEQEQAYFSRHTLQYNMALAEFYINEAPALERLNHVVSQNYYYQNLYQKRPLHRQQLAEKLGNEGLQALQKGHKATALELLQLAEQLHSDTRWQAGLNTISSAQKKRYAKAHKKQQRRQQEKIGQLQQRYKTLVKKEQWLAAQQQLEEFNDYKLDHKQSLWLANERDQLQTVVDDKVALHLKRGQILYSKGRIGEALSLWRAVSDLAPDNQKLQENITRAEKFQKRYNELRQ